MTCENCNVFLGRSGFLTSDPPTEAHFDARTPWGMYGLLI
jgi:hypothetical protein